MKHLKLYESFNDINILYHIAPTTKRESIQKEGINSESEKRYNNISENKVYAWEHIKMATWYALSEARDFEIDFDIWQIDYSDNIEEDDSIGLPYAVKIDSIKPTDIKLIDTASSSDKRINEYSDVEDIIEDIEDE